MVIGVGVRQKTAAAACCWRQLRFRTLRRKLFTPHTGEIRLPLVSSGVDAVPKTTVSIRVASNNEELLRRFQLEYFGFFHNACNSEEVSLGPFVEACVHVGPPSSLGYPYTLTSETDNFTEAVRRSEEYAAWEETKTSDGPHYKRWLTQQLLDGFVARCVVAHVGLSAGNMPQVLATARKLRLSLSPSDVSPYYFANEMLSSWGIFADKEKILDNPDIFSNHMTRLIQLAHASAVIPMYNSVWLNGAALCDDNGDSVLILGPPQSGKTTLALHCLAAAQSHLFLIGAENFHLAHPNALVKTIPTMDGGSPVLLLGVPTTVKVGIGALLGTLCSNPSLAAAAHTFDCSLSTIQQILRNSELTIWKMSSRYGIHISEAFGPRRWCPTFFGRLKGIVFLNWDVQELSVLRLPVNTGVLKWESKDDAVAVLTACSREHSNRSLFKGHYLVRSVYNEDLAMKNLERSIYNEDYLVLPPLYELRGSVNFDLAAKLVCNCILNKK